jgi:hypothetical protein
MVCTLFTYLNVQLKLLLSNILFNIYYYIMLRGPQGCLYSKVGLYFDYCQSKMMFAHQCHNNLIAMQKIV